jgi:hypothetical protein
MQAKTIVYRSKSHEYASVFYCVPCARSLQLTLKQSTIVYVHNALISQIEINRMDKNSCTIHGQSFLLRFAYFTEWRICKCENPVSG